MKPSQTGTYGGIFEKKKNEVKKAKHKAKRTYTYSSNKDVVNSSKQFLKIMFSELQSGKIDSIKFEKHLELFLRSSLQMPGEEKKK